MTALITGAAGFLGSHLFRLWPSDETVVCVDRLSPPIGWYPANCHYRQIDLLDDKALAALFDEFKPTTIIHLAAMSHTAAALAAGMSSIGVNVAMTQAVLRAMLMFRRGTGHPPHLVIAGSAAEYGAIGETDHPPHELSPLCPGDPYAISKAVSSMTALGYWEYFRLPVTVLRFANIYGPGQGPEKFVPIVIDRALKGEPLRLDGNGLPTRMWLYVDDACKAVLTAARAARGGVYNIAAHGEYSNRHVAELIHRHLKNLAPHHGCRISVPRIEFRAEGGGVRRVAMLIGLARRFLRWQAEIDLEEGLRRTVIAALADDKCPSLKDIAS